MVKEHYFLVRHSGLLREGKVAYFHFWPLELSITVQNFIQLACSQSLSHNKYMFFAGALGNLSSGKLSKGRDLGHIFS